MDYDAIWDAWLTAPGHETCGGFLYDPAADCIRCSCKGTIPLPFKEVARHGSA